MTRADTPGAEPDRRAGVQEWWTAATETERLDWLMGRSEGPGVPAHPSPPPDDEFSWKAHA
jgi:hypothetical protein